jgi:hypothetical protein
MKIVLTRHTRTAAGTLLTLLAAATPAVGQVAWDAPSLIAPGAPSGWGIHLFDPAPGDLGVFATWRGEPAPIGLGFRIGVAEGYRDDLAILGGFDVSGSMYDSGGEVPMRVIWFAGGGFGVADDVLLSFPAGVSMGWAFQGSEVAFRPYVAAKVVLDAFLGDEGRPSRFGDDDDLDLGAAFEVGMDLAFSPTFAIRAGASFGDRDAVSIGFQIPGR